MYVYYHHLSVAFTVGLVLPEWHTHPSSILPVRECYLITIAGLIITLRPAAGTRSSHVKRYWNI